MPPNLFTLKSKQMTDINILFTRHLLAKAHKLVKQHFPKINLVADCWIYHFHRDSWEFYGPNKFYWNGRADNAYEARYKGWMAWLEKRGVNINEDAA